MWTNFSLASQRWAAIDHIPIGHRWRGSLGECRSLWSKQCGLRSCFCPYLFFKGLVCDHIIAETICPTRLFLDDNPDSTFTRLLATFAAFANLLRILVQECRVKVIRSCNLVAEWFSLRIAGRGTLGSGLLGHLLKCIFLDAWQCKKTAGSY